MKNRKASVKRKTKETDITVSVNIDGSGALRGVTGVGFFDHMLELLARHSLMDLNLKVAGDLKVDAHHTVEDVGIVLGMALDKALGNRKGIRRYGWAIVPMDEALAEAVIDLGGRPYFSYRVKLPGARAKVGSFDVELVQEFFQALAFNAKMNLHMSLRTGKNLHHIAEALFKGFARAFDQAAGKDDRIKDVPSTKGTL